MLGRGCASSPSLSTRQAEQVKNGITIGQAATFVGVTVKTVRHYHKLGLVKEPERDSSGYRRYGSAELLRLVRVRTLAAAGVPLAEVGPLLDADPAGFDAALAGVERQLTERIEELIARRDMLHRLADGDRALLPDRAVALLERMLGLGFPADEVAAAREGWVLANALVPEGFDDYLTQVEYALDDPRYVALIKRGAEAAAWEPDDPRIDELATAMADHFLANPAHLKIVTGLQARTEAATRYRLIAHHGEEQGSTAAGALALVETKLRAAGIHIPRPDSH
ncbi:MerR family transcriptional regulator [Actinophytocola algeriensis]|uniref:DNA-binding transcriptional MerR regulator n=1 Tax=Actinophytocola algeriensis TaxID=1768010 RepID=A0A7W7VK22_9PSEU|nr:MerR family transcriptional regulator [Actinophytocola algeriensis]MBB4912630.1 DNA-binding transcriptional MerR regulator [Actinophytocola algeriensis]MBE1472036.1 DNA-binding transcriptional MerR regulator [Actinophytocola algeriensis]